MWHRVEERVTSFTSENFLFPLSPVFSDERRKSSKSPHAWDPDFYFILFYFILFYFIFFYFLFFFFVCFMTRAERDSSRRDTLELIQFLVVFTPMSSGFRRHRPALTASRRPQCRLGATYWETEAVGPLPPHRPFFFFLFFGRWTSDYVVDLFPFDLAVLPCSWLLDPVVPLLSLAARR